MTRQPSHTTRDRPLLGVVLMLGFCAIVPIADAMAKLLGGYPLTQLILIRFAAQAALLLPLTLWLRQVIFPTRRVAALTFLRALLQMSGIGMMFAALRALPLADAVAIAFVMPFIMLLLGWWFLGEEVGPRRFAACAVGFLGTLMVVQPSFAAVGAPALLPLAVAMIFAAFMLVTRQIAKEIEPVALQGATALFALPILLPFTVLPVSREAPLTGWLAPNLPDLWLFAVLGLAGSVAHLLMTWSLRFAPAATLAPMQYLEIPIAAFVGLVIFGEFPNGLALAGICVTIAAGLFVVMRERAASRAAAPPAA